MNTYKVTLRDGSPIMVEADNFTFVTGWIHFMKTEELPDKQSKRVVVAAFNEQSVQWLGRVKP